MTALKNQSRMFFSGELVKEGKMSGFTLNTSVHDYADCFGFCSTVTTSFVVENIGCSEIDTRILYLSHD